ncbi:MAG: hypothetical protein ACRED4_06805 [Brevundimonas sp.]
MLAVLLATLIGLQPLPPQDVVPQPDPAADSAVRLQDIEVVGRPLDDMIRNFVNEVAAPNSGRGIARWSESVCVGVANLKGEPAQYIVDRVSTVAEDIGLKPGAPGCSPNVLIIASADAQAEARHLVEQRSRAFRMGGSGMDRGGAALRAFQASEKPVRWWQVSMPVDSETGARATRIPGECEGVCNSVFDYAPVMNVFAASRLSTQIIDNIFRTIVIIDVDQIADVSIQQLADYAAMVTFAQIDPEADTSGYASILNVFDQPQAAMSLTDWDKAYLDGLYSAERTQKNMRAGRSEIVSSIHRAHEALQGQED